MKALRAVGMGGSRGSPASSRLGSPNAATEPATPAAFPGFNRQASGVGGGGLLGLVTSFKERGASPPMISPLRNSGLTVVIPETPSSQRSGGGALSFQVQYGLITPSILNTPALSSIQTPSPAGPHDLMAGGLPAPTPAPARGTGGGAAPEGGGTKDSHDAELELGELTDVGLDDGDGLTARLLSLPTIMCHAANGDVFVVGLR